RYAPLVLLPSFPTRRSSDLLLAIFVALFPLLLRGRRGGLQPRLNRGMLRIEIGEVGHEILHHRHVRERIDLHHALDIRHRLGAGDRKSTRLNSSHGSSSYAV